MKSKSTVIDFGLVEEVLSVDEAAMIGDAKALKAMAERITAEPLFTLLVSMWGAKEVRPSCRGYFPTQIPHFAW